VNDVVGADVEEEDTPNGDGVEVDEDDANKFEEKDGVLEVLPKRFDVVVADEETPNRGELLADEDPNPKEGVEAAADADDETPNNGELLEDEDPNPNEGVRSSRC
jgi:hypothetical protein